MSNRDQFALLLSMLLAALLLGCMAREGGGGTCHELWADCPGILNDYQICSSASDLEQKVEGNTRWFSYYNCNIGQRTPTLSVPAECEVTFDYP